MTVRIAIGADAEGVIVEVAGRLDGDGAVELEAAVASLSGPVRLDLADLRSTDAAGLTLLRDLRARGVSLTRMSPYHRLLLEGAGGSAPSPVAPPEGSSGNGAGRRGRPRRG